MTFNQLLNAAPTTFKCVGLSDHYEFWCKKCSYNRTYGISKKKVRKAQWQDSWQLYLSDELEKHHFWHEDKPSKSWESEQKKTFDDASRRAMQELNKIFGKLTR